MIICPKCGHDNDLGRVFCIACGHKLDLSLVRPPGFAEPAKAGDAKVAVGPTTIVSRRKASSSTFSVGKFLSWMVLIILVAFIGFTGFVVWSSLQGVGSAVPTTSLDKSDDADKKLNAVRKAILQGRAGQIVFTEEEINSWLRYHRNFQPPNSQEPMEMPVKDAFIRVKGEQMEVTVIRELRVKDAKRNVVFTYIGTPELKDKEFSFKVHAGKIGSLEVPLNFIPKFSSSLPGIFSKYDEMRTMITDLSLLDIENGAVKVVVSSRK